MAEQETLLPLKGTDSNVEPADPVDTKRSRTVRAFAAISVGLVATAGVLALTTGSKQHSRSVSKASKAEDLDVVAEDGESPVFCIEARNVNYDSLARHTLNMYKIDTVLEPFVSNEVTIQHCDESAPLDMDEYSVQWDATPVDGPMYAGQHSVITFADGISDDSKIHVTASPANAEFWLSAVVTNLAKSKTVNVAPVKAAVKSVRRELRRLTDEDRVAYFEALHEVFTTTTEKGQAKYGSGFTAHSDLTALHNSQTYQYHNNLFFQTSHPAMQLRLDRSLRAVNPSVQLPYWDFLMDAKLGAEWGTSVVYDDNWFGSVVRDDSNERRPTGRFNDVKRIYDPTEKTYPLAYHSVYGYVSGNNGDIQKTPWLTRSGSVCGFTLTQGFSNCEHVSYCFAKFLESGSSFAEYDLCMEYTVHANLHDMHAGMWDCQADFQDFYDANKDWLDVDLMSIVAVSMMQGAQNFVNGGYVSCPSSCDVATDSYETCSCVSQFENVKAPADVDELPMETAFKLAAENFWIATAHSYGGAKVVYTTDEGFVRPRGVTDENLFKLNKAILKNLLFPGFYGDMATGAAAVDPLFWVMHQLFDKAVHALRMSPTYNKNGFAWEQVDDADDKGKGWESDTPFKSEDFELGTKHELRGDVIPVPGAVSPTAVEGFLTNKQLWELLSPESNAITYIYDQLTDWGQCHFDPMNEMSKAELKEIMEKASMEKRETPSHSER
jgi:hypothetical protein